MRNPFAARPLTRGRIVLAIAIAGATDALQIALGPLGWTFVDEIADVVAMILISLLIGFHPLLLPTFILEIFPLVDMLPTWTGCVGAVILWRRNMGSPGQPPAMDGTNAPASPSPRPPTEETGPIIDV
jgi:hypothetical protein